MDDILERPPLHSKSSGDEEQSSGDEDGALDWTKLAKHVPTRPVIPERGEKDFEPVHGRDSDLQLHVLDQARGAMFETLRARRGISRKSASYGIWYPSVVRVHVVTHGVHFASMGHSISRASRVLGSTKPELAQNYKTEKHLELLPEEAIYLIEREVPFCYKSIPAKVEETIPGAPMKVQQAYAGMIGREDMRLGFVLRCAKPHTLDLPIAPSHSLCDMFKALRILQCSHGAALYNYLNPDEGATVISPTHSTISSSASPYSVSFHVYKPAIPFRKTAPPLPDFYLVRPCRDSARATATPSLYELVALFEGFPEMTLPPLRKQKTQTVTKKANDAAVTDTSPRPPRPSVPLSDIDSTPTLLSSIQVPHGASNVIHLATR
ncbi:hypothetical protein EDD16DRAFT_1696651 [Pisolithus croceorrhizus]|nr:hypothetical protein EDD16DRAFT_1696651 [Pisolithus croceorrhizus]KAI6113159.1 hypothetical protein EV401DRAFT_2058783 [Pisolithus croceorrhizus]